MKTLLGKCYKPDYIYGHSDSESFWEYFAKTGGDLFGLDIYSSTFINCSIRDFI